MPVAAHDDALLAGERGQPAVVGEIVVAGGDPARAVGEEEVLALHVGLVGLDPVPEVAVVDGQRAGLHAQDLLAGGAVVGVVLLQVLGAVAAGHVDEVAHARRGEVGEPVADAHAQRQLGREHLVRQRARAVRVPGVAPGAARADAQVAAQQLQHLPEHVVDVAHVAVVVDQLRDRGIELDRVLLAQRLPRPVARIGRRHAVDCRQVVVDLVRRQRVLDPDQALLLELPPLLVGEPARCDA